MINDIWKKFGRVDACFNCAGIEGERNKIEQYSTQMFDEVINTNLKGTWLCMKY